MSWKNEAFASFKLYAVTDYKGADVSSAADFLARIDAACRGGADIVQLRAKNLSDSALFTLGQQMRKITASHKKLFFVNDRPDLAVALEADGIHIGQDDLPVDAVRKIISGRPILIGKSTHCLKESLAAEAEGVDYVGVGPVFSTPTKPDYQAVGLEFVRQAAGKLKIPFVAIGGIDLGNIRSVLDAGARRVAVVRAIFDAKEPYEAAKRIRAEISHAD